MDSSAATVLSLPSLSALYDSTSFLHSALVCCVVCFERLLGSASGVVVTAAAGRGDSYLPPLFFFLFVLFHSTAT